MRCPYGVVGDRLWVKETWAVSSGFDDFAPRDLPWPLAASGIQYNATPGEYRATGKTRVSIHMPRVASRITLEVTEVRVQRLQQITDLDAVAEGVEGLPSTGRPWLVDRFGLTAGEPVDRFRVLWESISGADSWVKNPWVWAISFKRLAP